MAALLGSAIIEKHFTHDKSLPGNDHYHAMNVHDLKLFQQSMDRVFGLLGEFRVKALEDEEISRKNARRSLIAKYDLKAGQEITENDLTFKRPAYGISPRSIDELVGRKVLKDIPEDTVLHWNMFE